MHPLPPQCPQPESHSHFSLPPSPEHMTKATHPGLLTHPRPALCPTCDTHRCFHAHLTDFWVLKMTHPYDKAPYPSTSIPTIPGHIHAQPNP